MLLYNVLFKGVEIKVNPYPQICKTFGLACEYAERTAEKYGLEIKSESGFFRGDEFTVDSFTDYRCEDQKGNSYYFVIYVQEI